MDSEEKVNVLKVYVSEHEKTHGGEPIYDAIIRKARDMEILSASIYRCSLYHGFINSLSVLSFSSNTSKDPPLMIEIIDLPEKLDDFLIPLDKLLDECNEAAVVIQKASIKRFEKTRKFNEFAIF